MDATSLALSLLVLGFSAAVFYQSHLREWISGLQTTKALAGDYYTFFRKCHAQNRDWVRVVPGQRGGSRTIMPIDMKLIQNIYSAPIATVATSESNWYFDFALFAMSRTWLAHFEIYKSLENVLYKQFAGAGLEELGERFSIGWKEALEGIDARVTSQGGQHRKLFGDVLLGAAKSFMQAFFGPDLPADRFLPAIKRVERNLHFMGACIILPVPYVVSRNTIARQGYRSLADCKRIFKEWRTTGLYRSAAPGVVGFIDQMLAPGLLPESDADSICCTIAFAAAGNSHPVCFWLLLFIASSPDMLERVRKEVAALRERGDPTELSVAKFSNGLPLLRSCLAETMRLFVVAFGARQGSSGRPLELKAGNMLLLNGSHAYLDEALYTDPQTWRGDRFLNEQGDYESPPDLNTFGGGIGLCRGRHLAVYEILTVVATLVERYDFDFGKVVDYEGRPADATIRAVHGETAIRSPPIMQGRVGIGAVPPEGDIEVLIRRRHT